MVVHVPPMGGKRTLRSIKKQSAPHMIMSYKGKASGCVELFKVLWCAVLGWRCTSRTCRLTVDPSQLPSMTHVCGLDLRHSCLGFKTTDMKTTKRKELEVGKIMVEHRIDVFIDSYLLSFESGSVPIYSLPPKYRYTTEKSFPLQSGASSAAW